MMAARLAQGFELLMYGDSIMETLRGTDHERHCRRLGRAEGQGILRAHFADRWRTAVIATGGGHKCGECSAMRCVCWEPSSPCAHRA